MKKIALILVALAALLLPTTPAFAGRATGELQVTGDFVHGGTIHVEALSDIEPRTTWLSCSQDGQLVLIGGSRDYADFGGQDFILSSQVWISGPAQCTLELVTYRRGVEVKRPLDVVKFDVSG
jgi:hypothetical protein